MSAWRWGLTISMLPPVRGVRKGGQGEELDVEVLVGDARQAKAELEKLKKTQQQQ